VPPLYSGCGRSSSRQQPTDKPIRSSISRSCQEATRGPTPLRVGNPSFLDARPTTPRCARIPRHTTPRSPSRISSRWKAVGNEDSNTGWTAAHCFLASWHRALMAAGIVVDSRPSPANRKWDQDRIIIRVVVVSVVAAGHQACFARLIRAAAWSDHAPSVGPQVSCHVRQCLDMLGLSVRRR
jgi:hypothetical protein